MKPEFIPAGWEYCPTCDCSYSAEHEAGSESCRVAQEMVAEYASED